MGRQGKRTFRRYHFLPNPLGHRFYIDLFRRGDLELFYEREHAAKAVGSEFVPGPRLRAADRILAMHVWLGQASLDECAVQVEAHIDMRPGLLKQSDSPID